MTFHFVPRFICASPKDHKKTNTKSGHGAISIRDFQHSSHTLPQKKQCQLIPPYVLWIHVAAVCDTCQTVPCTHERSSILFFHWGSIRFCHFGALWLWVGQSEDKNVHRPNVNVNAQDVHISKCGSRPYRWRYCCSDRQAWSNVIDAKKSKWNFNWRTSVRIWLIKGVAWWRPWSSKKSDKSIKCSSIRFSCWA